MVALHFAAFGSTTAKERTFFRIDFEQCIPLVLAAYLGHEFCIRGQVQSAWGLWLADKDKWNDFDLQNCSKIDNFIEKHILIAKDADDYIIPNLTDDSNDGYVVYPLALIRGFKYAYGRPFPPSLAEWISERIPLYDWIPCDIIYSPGCLNVYFLEVQHVRLKKKLVVIGLN